MFTLDIKCVNGGHTYQVIVDEDEVVEFLKQRINDQGGPVPDKQRLMYMGTRLENQKMLKEHSIYEGVTLHLVTCQNEITIIKIKDVYGVVTDIEYDFAEELGKLCVFKPVS